MKRLLSMFLALLLLSGIPFSGLADDRAYLKEHISVLGDADIPPTPAGVHHYLLIGMDKWQNNPENQGYNDGLVLLTFDELAGRVIVTSFIRDMLIIRPDGNPGRINRVVREYGVEDLLKVINRHFGIRVEKYVLMDWRHIMEIVDACGGVTLDLTSDEAHYLKGWSVPVNSTQPVLNGAGTYHLNGFASVIYMRIRKRRASNNLDTQDFGRTFRVRTVLSGLAGNIKGYDINQAQDLLTKVLNIWNQPFDKGFTYPGIKNNGIFTFGIPPRDPTTKRYKTNISMADMLEAVRVAFLLRNSQVEQWRLPADGTVRQFTYAGGDGQLLDFEQNRALLHDFMFPESFMVVE
ncbi:MAG: hypothetical protein GX171_06535 [Clostridiales bacterium]|nr:hypothetical protein [Clostridiales bacterium]